MTAIPSKTAQQVRDSLYRRRCRRTAEPREEEDCQGASFVRRFPLMRLYLLRENSALLSLPPLYASLGTVVKLWIIVHYNRQPMRENASCSHTVSSVFFTLFDFALFEMSASSKELLQ